MRRKDREITEKAVMEDIIRKAAVCRLALCDGNIPYIVPMNFGYKDDCIYFHSAREGKKLDILKKNPNICFEVDAEPEFVRAENACEWSMKYSSVIAFGKAGIVDDYEEKINALNIIMEHYSGKPEHNFKQSAVDRIVIIKAVIDEMTGKKSG